MVGLLSGMTWASVIVRQDLESFTLSGLNGQTDGNPYFSGAWQNSSGTVVNTGGTPLEANGTDGGAQAISLGNRPRGNGVERFFTTPVDPTDLAPIYMSFILRFDDLNRDRWAGFHDAGHNWDHSYFGLDLQNGGTEAVGIISRSYNNVSTGSITVDPTNDIFLMFRVTDSDLTLWANPGAETDTPLLTSSIHPNWDVIQGIGFTGDSNAFSVDRFVMGTSFATVIPEPSSLALLGLGVLLLHTRKRYKR